MTGRPTRRVIWLEVAALAAALAVAIWRNGDSDWDIPLLGVLLAGSIAGDLTALDTSASRIKISSSFLTIVTAMVFLGETPAALIAVATILAGWVRFRYSPTGLLMNVVTYAWFPLLAGTAFHATVNATGAGQMDGLFYLLVFGVFVLALVLDFVLIAAYLSY